MKFYLAGDEPNIATRLTGIYVRMMIWYFLGMALLWAVGIESIYGHPTPFYAQFTPVFTSAFTPRAVLACIIIFYFPLRGLTNPDVRFSNWRTATVTLFVGLLLIYVVHLEALQGNESIGHATARIWAEFSAHLVAFAVFITGITALILWVRGRGGFKTPLSNRETVWALTALVAFCAIFSSSIGMLRGGPEGITQAYERQAYEYIGDIGKTSSIRALFSNYVDIHANLSMHAKVHPPGPITLLWLFSYAIGQEPMPLSLATIFFGSLAIIPLYLWAREICDPVTALSTCFLYSLIPSIILFTATSADILFAPFTIATLYLFDRAIRRKSWLSAVCAGIGFGLMAHLKFSLLAFGAYYAFVGLWFLMNKRTRPNVFVTAFSMLVGFFGTILAIRWWSGFDIIAVFQASKAQFDLDQHHLDQLSPRFPSWVYRFINPLTWFYFAGLPVSFLVLWRLLRRDHKEKALFFVFLLTIFVLNLLYLARGEGERSALYLFPFLAIPAAHAVNELCQTAKSYTPLYATLAFLAFQCWLTESFFYTYW
jgi:hypothetical protein